MTEEQQRIAIAEACGWDFDPLEASQWKSRGKWVSGPKGVPAMAFAHNIPDYLNDLNAMHEAEKVLNQMQSRTHSDHLSESAQNGTWASCHIWHQSAAQRAEAFLRTIDKWTTNQPTEP